MARPEAEKQFVIYFMPRSGSSRITDIATQAGVLGQPGEPFNKHHTSRIAEAYGAANFQELCAVLPRARNKGNAAGFEITYGMVSRCFGEAKFAQKYGAFPSFWLIREDIVGQAISAMKMVKLGVSHAPKVDGDSIKRADERFRYNGLEIYLRVLRLHQQEILMERFFVRFEIKPLRLSYERMSARSDTDVARILARHIGQDLPDGLDLQTEHQKLASQRNLEFKQRFAERHPRFLRLLDAARAPMLSKLSD